MKGTVKWPLKYFNEKVETSPAELGRWMSERNLTYITVYELGWVIQYELIGRIARPK